MNRNFRTVSAPAKLALGVALLAGTVFAQQNSIGFDAYRFANQGGASYFDLVATANQFDSIDVTLASGSTQGGGAYVGVPNLTMNAADYQLEVKYKLNTGHVADTINIVARQNDGKNTGGMTSGEDFQWQFHDLVNRFNSGTPDADGYVTLVRDITELPNPVNSSTTESWEARYQAFGKDVDGDAVLDTHVVEGGEPNGILELQIQANGDGGTWDPLNVSFKSVRFVQKNPGNVVATFDNSGVNGTWGAVAAAGGFQRDDTTALTNVLIDAQAGGDGTVSGGAWLKTLPSETNFNANDYKIELTARILPNNAATEMSVILKDLDGYVADATLTPASGEEYGYNFDLSQLNSTSMTTLTMDANSPSWTNARAFDFAADGDGDMTDFNLYEFQIGSIFESTERLNIEVESVKIVSNAAASTCDFDARVGCDIDDLDLLYEEWGVTGGPFDVNGNGTVEAGDISSWLALASNPSNPANPGAKTFVLGDVDLDGDVDSGDLGSLLNNFGDSTGVGYGSGNLNDDAVVDSSDLGALLNVFGATSASAAAVPEPNALPLLGLGFLSVLAVRRRR